MEVNLECDVNLSHLVEELLLTSELGQLYSYIIANSFQELLCQDDLFCGIS